MIRLAILATAGILHAQAGYQYFVTGNAADVKAKTTFGVLLAGGGDVVVLRASGTDAYNSYFLGLAKLDSVETIVFKSEAAARAPFVLEKIRNAEAIFLAGGDQWNYVRYWNNTPVAAVLNDAIGRGVPVGGTSAGLVILGESVFSAEHDTVTSDIALADPFHEKVTIHRGLLRIPMLRCLITDSHFAQRERMGRLLVFWGEFGLRMIVTKYAGLGLMRAPLSRSTKMAWRKSAGKARRF